MFWMVTVVAAFVVGHFASFEVEAKAPPQCFIIIPSVLVAVVTGVEIVVSPG